MKSFNGRARDELLNVEEFGYLAEAQIPLEACELSTTPTDPLGLGGLSPAEYARQWTTRHQPALS